MTCVCGRLIGAVIVEGRPGPRRSLRDAASHFAGSRRGSFRSRPICLINSPQSNRSRAPLSCFAPQADGLKGVKGERKDSHLLQPLLPRTIFRRTWTIDGRRCTPFRQRLEPVPLLFKCEICRRQVSARNRQAFQSFWIHGSMYSDVAHRLHRNYGLAEMNSGSTDTSPRHLTEMTSC
jgi:hypothetical protein